MTSNDNTTKNNNVSTPTACNSDPTKSNFGVYQQTLVWSSEISIDTLISDDISAEPYYKALIVKFFFRQILPLSDNSFVSIREFNAAVVSYCSINTSSTERKVGCFFQKMIEKRNSEIQNDWWFDVQYVEKVDEVE